MFSLLNVCGMMYKDCSLYPIVTIVIAVFILEVNYWILITACKYVISLSPGFE